MQSLLIVATMRGDEVQAGSAMSALRRRLCADDVLSTIALGGLSERDVCALIALVPLLSTDAEGTGREIFKLTSGNALFVCELVRDRIESPDSPTSATRDIRHTIIVRAERLSPAARMLADAASVVGMNFDIETVGRLAGAGESAVMEGFAELLDRRMIKEAGHGHFEFAFTHNLIQVTLYEAVDEKRRRRWHTRVAALLEQLPAVERPGALRSLARHYEASGQFALASETYLESANHALAVFANDEAFEDASGGLRLPDLEPGRRFALLLARERAGATGGNPAARQADIQELSALLPSLADIDAECEVLCRRVRLARAQSETELEGRLVAELVERASGSGLTRRHAEALQERASWLRLANRYDEAYAAAEEARERYASIGDAVGSAECDCVLSEIASTRGSAVEMQRFITEARSTALFAGNKALFARSTMAASATALMERNFAVARELAFQALELYREMGDREGEADARSRYATALGSSNQLDESRREYGVAAELCRRLGKKKALGYLLFNMSATELQLGRLDDAFGSLTEADGIFEVQADLRGHAVCLTNLSMVALLRGDARKAQRLAQEALAAALELKSDVIQAAALSNLGNAERDLADYEGAISHMNEALRIRESMGHPGAYEELSDLALALLQAGDVDAAVALSRTTLQRARTSNDNNVWPHYCFWVGASAFHRAGADEEAAAALDEARRLMSAMAARIEDAESRAAFLSLPMNEGILAASERGAWQF
jgi:tetratricopeptide (TPR) repeat protein